MRDQNPVFIPGPTNMPESLRHAMNVPTSDHRSSDFQHLLLPLLQDLKKIFKTESGDVLLFPASGTGGWEAAITNSMSPGDKVLVARYGMFSHRWIDLCQRHGLDVEIIECDWGSGAPADRFGDTLANDKSDMKSRRFSQPTTKPLPGCAAISPRFATPSTPAPTRPCCSSIVSVRLLRWIFAWTTGASTSRLQVRRKVSCSPRGSPSSASVRKR